MADDPSEVLAKIELYRTAFASAQYEGNLIWLVFSAMTVANGIILGIVGSLWPTGDDELGHQTAVLIMGASVLGVAMCRRWYWAMLRMWKLYGYWWAWAKKYESQIGQNGTGPAQSLGDYMQGGFPKISSWRHDENGAPLEVLTETEKSHRNGEFARLVPAWFASAHAGVFCVAAISAHW
ncbi:hypothetical protein INR77_13535 [Erythrobacter sp. SCSIO 43205]|uniref:RipA family octameric membrane protein n=1 Tax=Erythrobacter sp. SCSIO 43205 TaxID=2779361 RepID=UPI001CA94AED|nr:hypothetical protein [Erythrobacter sp. SCSIO 43205]UAB77784.1 hypothetical protein INR77_13535 [Erythrobacter sp. SCSIO 43205]